jgi:hypothetical protein
MTFTFNSLNSFWSSLGVTELSFLAFLKIIFFIILIILNIGLLYCEFKNIDHIQKSGSPKYLQTTTSTELKKIAVGLISTIGGIASIITIKDDIIRRKKEEEWKEQLAQAQAESKRITSEKIANDFHHKLQIDYLQRKHQEIIITRTEKSALTNYLKENPDKTCFSTVNEGTIIDHFQEYNRIRREKATRLDELNLIEKRQEADLGQGISRSHRFTTEINKVKNDNELLELLNSDVKNSAIFDLDIEELLKKLLNKFDNFETLNGISKLMVTTIISNYLILWCLYGMLINIYGEYLMDRFQLASRYPRLA